MFLKWKHCTCMLGVRPHVMLSICITRHQSNTSHLPPQPSKNDKSSQIQSTGRIPLSNPPFVVETLWLYHLPQRRQFSWNSDAPEWVLVLGVELNIQTSWCLQYCPTKPICDRQESCPTVCCIWMSLVLHPKNKKTNDERSLEPRYSLEVLRGLVNNPRLLEVLLLTSNWTVPTTDPCDGYIYLQEYHKKSTKCR